MGSCLHWKLFCSDVLVYLRASEDFKGLCVFLRFWGVASRYFECIFLTLTIQVCFYECFCLHRGCMHLFAAQVSRTSTTWQQYHTQDLYGKLPDPSRFRICVYFSRLDTFHVPHLVWISTSCCAMALFYSTVIKELLAMTYKVLASSPGCDVKTYSLGAQ